MCFKMWMNTQYTSAKCDETKKWRSFKSHHFSNDMDDSTELYRQVEVQKTFLCMNKPTIHLCAERYPSSQEIALQYKNRAEIHFYKNLIIEGFILRFVLKLKRVLPQIFARGHVIFHDRNIERCIASWHDVWKIKNSSSVSHQCCSHSD